MIGRIGESELEPIRFGHKHLDVWVLPVLRRYILQQYHQPLEVFLFEEFVAPVQQEGGAHVQLEYGETVRFGEVRVPQTDSARQGKLSRQ